MKNLWVRGRSSTNISAMNNNIRNTQRRLQDIEKQLKIEPIPSFQEFKSEWERMDSLSCSVLAAEAESGDFESMNRARRKYMLAVRTYLLEMGLIDKNAKSFQEIADELEKEN